MVQTEEPRHEVQLVAGAVVDPAPVAEGLVKVGLDLGYGVGGSQAELLVPGGTGGFHLVEEVAEDFVSEPRASRVIWWRLLHQGLGRIKDGENGPDGGAAVFVLDG